MIVRVLKCFTDKTLVGKHGSFRDVGAEFDCPDDRADELASLGLVEPSAPDEELPVPDEAEYAEGDEGQGVEPAEGADAETIEELKKMDIKELRAFADEHDLVVRSFGNTAQIRKAIIEALEEEGE